MNNAVANYDSVAAALTGVALFGWILIRILAHTLPGKYTHLFMLPFTFTVAWFFWNSGLNLFASVVETVTPWSHNTLALGAAIASESVLAMYFVRATSFSWLRFFPAMLRVAMIAALVLILMEPIISHREEHSTQRHIAVLLDHSASMTLEESNTAANGRFPGRTRYEAMRGVLFEETGGRTLLDNLQADYGVRLYEYATTARELRPPAGMPLSDVVKEPDAAGSWAQGTQIASAIERVESDLPLRELSGVIFLTDGCDHSSGDLQAASFRLANRDIPIHSVVIGSQSPIRDAEVVSVQIPQQIFQGDSVSIKASIKADELGGQKAMVRLFADGKLLEEKRVSYMGKRYRETLSFEHRPTGLGVHEYVVQLDEVDEEAIAENNQSTSRLWVSDDRIRMLIVENRPRWEFGYLRDLFAGRDRSVYLQHVLLRPTRLAGVPDPPIMHAAVGRAFDDCEATALPRTTEEWLKFNVIVLGDVSPKDLGADVLQMLQTFVRDRGGSLVVISGRQSMPHAFAGTPLEDILPVHLDGVAAGHQRSPDLKFYLHPATGAESHVIMQQSEDVAQSNAVWGSLPELHWRHPASRAKAGATVLAYAARQQGVPLDFESQRERALAVWHRFGAGKVFHLAFDQTWRLRYGIGNKHHHKFWGQVLRWAIGDRLPAGTELVRMGIDRSLYRLEEPVTVRARLFDQNHTTIPSRDTQINIYLDDELVQAVRMAPDPDSNGMLLAEVRGLDRPGKYRAELGGPTVSRLLQAEGLGEVSVSSDFAIEGPDPTVELSDVVADATIPLQLADWTGGIVTTPDNATDILEHLGPKSTFHREQWTVPMWNKWPVIALFLSFASLEWIFRRFMGLV